jgi:hypothetical protein
MVPEVTSKTSSLQYAESCFLASLGCDGGSNLAFLDVEDCISRFPLGEDRLFPGKNRDFAALADSGKESRCVEIAIFLGRRGMTLPMLLPGVATSRKDFARIVITKMFTFAHICKNPRLAKSMEPSARQMC